MITALTSAFLVGSYLPAAQEAKPDFPSRDEVKVVVIHDDQATCSDYPKTFRCPEVKHWVLSVNEVKSADRARVEAFIKSEADRRRTPDPKNPTLSELRIKILAESGAPYSEISSLMNKCAKMGVYRLELGEQKTEARTGAIASALGVGTRAKVGGQDVLLLVGKQEAQKDDEVRWIDGIRIKKAIEDAAKDRGPRDELPILLDPLPATWWTEVILIMDILKRLGFERLEFAAPFSVSDPPKK